MQDAASLLDLMALLVHGFAAPGWARACMSRPANANSQAVENKYNRYSYNAAAGCCAAAGPDGLASASLCSAWLGTGVHAKTCKCPHVENKYKRCSCNAAAARWAKHQSQMDETLQSKDSKDLSVHSASHGTLVQAIENAILVCNIGSCQVPRTCLEQVPCYLLRPGAMLLA